jgi:hypothetical protein
MNRPLNEQLLTCAQSQVVFEIFIEYEKALLPTKQRKLREYCSLAQVVLPQSSLECLGNHLKVIMEQI